MGAGTGSEAALLPRPRSDARALRHEPGLDGLRGLAVAGVLLFHGGLSWATGGFLGVSTFFTLSGFLITTLLLFEHDAVGRIDLRRFWTRRLRRLLPAALLALTLAVVYVALLGERHQYDRLRLDVGAALLYSENWRLILGGNSYVTLFSSPSPVQHFWSLAIEEQFYLVFPIMAAALLASRRGSRLRFTVALVAAAVASLASMFVLYHPGGDPSRAYYGSDTRALELVVGALLAVVLSGRGGAALARSTRLRGAVAALGAIGLVATVAAWCLATDVDSWLYRGGLALYAVGSCCIILAALVPGPVRTLLSAAPLRALGRISYGVYLYHWPVFLWLTPARTDLAGIGLFALRCSVTVGLAALSYRFVEDPIRRGRRITRRGSWVVAPVAALALCGFLAFVTADPPRPTVVFRAARGDGRHPPPAATGTPSPTVEVAGAIAVRDATAPPPVTRVLLVGDSVAQTLGRGLERWGPAHGVTIWNAARYYCGVLRSGEVQILATQRSCDQWDRWREQVAEFQPEVVVVLSTIWDVVPRQWQPGEAFVAVGDPSFDDRFVDEYTQAIDVLAAGGAEVVVLAPMCNSNPEHSRRLRYARQRLLPRVRWARSTEVRIVDVTERICPDGDFHADLGGIVDARPDGNHFSDPAADSIATWLMPTVLDPAPEITSVSMPIAWPGVR